MAQCRIQRRLAGDPPGCATSGEVKDLRREAGALKEVVADLSPGDRLLKKHERGGRRRNMETPAAEKAEIIWLVEQSHLPARRTLVLPAIPRITFYRR
jgi:hypothetical protein